MLQLAAALWRRVLNRLTGGDSLIAKVLRGGALATLLKGLAVLGNLGASWLLAHEAGPAGVGVYFLCLSFVTFAALAGRLGNDIVAMRIIAVNAAAGAWSTARAAAAYALRWSAPLTLAMAVGLALFAPLLAEWRANPDLEPLLRVGALAVVGLSGAFLFGQFLRGAGAIAASQAVYLSAPPLLTFAAMVGLALAGALTPFNAMIGYAAATALAALWGALLWRRASGGARATGAAERDDHAAGAFDRAAFLPASLDMFLIALVNFGIAWAPLWVAATMADEAALGVFVIALRLAAAFSLLSGSLGIAIAPDFAVLHQRGETATLARVARRTTRLLIIMIAPGVALFVFAPGFLLGLFGSEFAAAAWLVVLTLGEALSTATGNVGQLLMMTGRERLARNNNLMAMAAMIVLAFALGSLWGLFGVALGVALGQVLRAVHGLRLVRRELGFWAI